MRSRIQKMLVGKGWSGGRGVSYARLGRSALTKTWNQREKEGWWPERSLVAVNILMSVCSQKVEFGVIRFWECSTVSGRLHGDRLWGCCWLAAHLVYRPQTLSLQGNTVPGSLAYHRFNGDGFSLPQAWGPACHRRLTQDTQRSLPMGSYPSFHATRPVAQHMAPLNGFWHQRGIYFLDKAAKIVLHLCS